MQATYVQPLVNLAECVCVPKERSAHLIGAIGMAPFAQSAQAMQLLEHAILRSNMKHVDALSNYAILMLELK